MFLEFCNVTGELKVELPGYEKHTVKWKKDDVPGIPVLTNKAPVKKHTRLVALDDLQLHRIREEDLKKKKDEDQKKNKLESGEAGPAAKKSKS